MFPFHLEGITLTENDTKREHVFPNGSENKPKRRCYCINQIKKRIEEFASLYRNDFYRKGKRLKPLFTKNTKTIAWSNGGSLLSKEEFISDTTEFGTRYKIYCQSCHSSLYCLSYSNTQYEKKKKRFYYMETII